MSEAVKTVVKNQEDVLRNSRNKVITEMTELGTMANLLKNKLLAVKYADNRDIQIALMKIEDAEMRFDKIRDESAGEIAFMDSEEPINNRL